jgi:UDP-N-acetylmuramoylalanine--D-glutamate ligase
VRCHIAGNIQGVATLDLVGKLKKGDIVVLELSSWQLQGFHDRKLSPHISVFTNFLDDHMNYYGGSMKKYFSDKSAIFKYQKKGDLLIAGSEVSKLIPKTLSKKVVANKNIIPKNWNIKIPGEHNRENISFAVLVAGALGVPISKIKKAVESFHGVHGRLEFVKNIRGIKIYNDNSSSTPDSTLTALKALSSPITTYNLETRNLILIMGGSDKGLDMTPLVKVLPKYLKHLVLLDGSGTQSLKVGSIKVPFNYADNLEDAVAFALEHAKKGDTILFSPAFASFGMFVNVYDREKKFMKIVKKIK